MPSKSDDSFQRFPAGRVVQSWSEPRVVPRLNGESVTWRRTCGRADLPKNRSSRSWPSRSPLDRTELARNGHCRDAARALRDDELLNRMLSIFIFLNGAFGVGKTTVARTLQKRLPESRLYDPEYAGVILQRLPNWLPIRGQETGDFQDIPLWRSLTVTGLRLSALVNAHTIVPMAFSNLDYLESIIGRASSLESKVRCFCLMAPINVVCQRLRDRGDDQETRRGAWVYRRAAECCEAHQSPGFGEQILTANRTVDSVVEEIVTRLGMN